MKTRFSLLIVMVLLLGLLPAVAVAAPSDWFVTVSSWTLPFDNLDPLPIAKLSAWGVNWQVPAKATQLEFGYVYCKGGPPCERVVLYTTMINKSNEYPQNLSLASKEYYRFVLGDCTIQEFVRILDKKGKVVDDAWSPVEDRVCFAP